MGFSITVDWQNYYDKGWENIGRQTMEGHFTENPKEYADWYGMDLKEVKEKIKIDGGVELEGDDFEPMMNYAYPLEVEPDSEAIAKVCSNTNCTVMYNTEEDTYYLALTGGGMDLSQDIALAYIYTDKWIPVDLIQSVCTQPALSVSMEKWKLLKKEIIKQIGNTKGHLDFKMKEWEDAEKRQEKRIKERANG